jgi:hypothetical protein
VTDNVGSAFIARLGHLCGLLSLVLIAVLVVETYFRSAPAPHISGAVFLLFFFGAMLLSAVAGKLASRWWFIQTGCLVVLMVLVWIGEFFFENKL